MNKQFFFDQFFDTLKNMSRQKIIENDFFLGQIHLPFPISKLLKIPKRNDIIMDTFEFRIPWVFSSIKRFKYFPFLLDVSWWWENWFLKQFHVRRDLVLENLKVFNPYFDLLFQFLEIYKKNNFLLRTKFDFNNFNKSLYNSDVFLVLIDRIFVSNIRKNFFLYYKTKNGFDFIFFQLFFFLSHVYLFYKKFENLVFYDFIANHRYHGLNNDYRYELDDLISKIKKSKFLKKKNLLKSKKLILLLNFLISLRQIKNLLLG